MTGSLIPSRSLSHGTLEVRDMEVAKRFYREFLGLNCVRPLEPAQTIWCGGDWIIVCVGVGETVSPQLRDNRWGLLVGSAAEVDAAREAAVAQTPKWELQAVDPVEEQDGRRAFALQDRDGNWWEIYHDADAHAAERAFAAAA